MRVATIDIGTNSVLLLVAERTSDGRLVPVVERATVTRLGQGVDATRVLSPDAIARTRACLENYAELVEAHGATRVAVVGTSAMRDAKGGEAVVDAVRALFGVDARVISGDEEARLTFAGALSGLDVPPREPVIVFDIGGGSTEVVQGAVDEHGRIAALEYAKSFDIGSVRLTERHIRSDPPSLGELARARDDADAALASLPALRARGPAVGIAGTVTTLVAVAEAMAPYDGARVHGYTMTNEALGAVVAKLAALPLEDRRKVPGLDPKRADVIVAGGIVVQAVLAALGKDAFRASDRGVRWGLAEELALEPPTR
jgi:exopolyphosphatase/guanosine-5'-triphosphate,3'-diphosphate pyrophosphatase